jgi:hypothetical protein
MSDRLAGLWPELIDAAVVGARRAAPPATPAVIADVAEPRSSAGAGERAGGQPDADEAGGRLLHLAAVASRARRAGYVPAAGGDLAAPPAVSPDERPSVSRAARLRLAELLAAERTDLVIEWVRLLARTGRRPPDALVPALLGKATYNAELRDVLRPVLGPLAGWLAVANPAWNWASAGAAPPPGRGDWTTAGRQARIDLLEQTRRRDPATGRDLVGQTWATDSHQDRAAFVAALAVGLSADDEPLLDRALADRRGEVRRAGAGLLARLPGSAYFGRAVSRAAGAVRVSASASGPALEVTPPGEATAEMIADTLDASPPRGTGLQAWLLRQVVAAVPAAWWAEQAGLSPAGRGPAGLLALAAETEWAWSLQEGWADAAIRDAHGPWLAALLEGPSGPGAQRPHSLLTAMAADDRDRWLEAHVDSPLFDIAAEIPAPWSARLSAAVSRRIAIVVGGGGGVGGGVGGGEDNGPGARLLLRAAAARLDPPAWPDLNPMLVHPQLADHWAAMMNTLSVRAAMRRELSQEPPP